MSSSKDKLKKMSNDYTIKDLKKVATAKRIKDRSKMNRTELYEAVKEWLTEFEEDGRIAKKSPNKMRLFMELAKPDEKGYSRSVCVSEFVGKYQVLRFSNGGDWCRFDNNHLVRKQGDRKLKYRICTLKANGVFRCSQPFNDDENEEKINSTEKEMRFGFEKENILDRKGNAIVYIKLCGYTYTSPHPISREIRKALEGNPCVACGSKHDVEVDHKNGLYNDPKVLDVTTQKLSDFQPLCRHCNLQKRQTIKKMKETGKRYGATKIPALKPFGIDFIEGNKNCNFEDVNWAVGTYWYDPVAFMEGVLSRLRHSPDPDVSIS